MARVIGLDPGDRRIGIAVSEPSGTIASPHGFVDVEAGDVIEAITRLADALEATTVVIGLPLRLDGTEGPAAERSRTLGQALADTGLVVEYQDERFTTVTAEAALIEGGVRRSKRKNTRDQVAASVMLQGYLDGSRHRGNPDDSTGGA